MRLARTVGAALVAALLVALGLLLGAVPASAHAQIVASNPANGERLEGSPDQLRFVLSEAADLDTVAVTLTGPDGPVTGLGRPSRPVPTGDRRDTIVVPVSTTLARGLYRVTFQVRSAVDGHNTVTDVVFGVQTDVVDAPVDQVESASAADTARTVAQGIGLLAAGLAFGLLLLGRTSGRRSDRLALVAAGTAAACSIVGGLLWHDGIGLVVAILGSVGAGLLALAAARGATPGALWLADALVLAVAPLSLIGHAAAQGTWMIATSALHLVCTAAWTGTVTAYVLLSRRDGSDRQAALHIVSRVGTVTFFVSVVTGLVMSGAVIPSVGGLLDSLYGRGILSKALLVVPLLALAAIARWRLRRGRTTSLKPEALVMLGIAAIAVAVSTLPPPQTARFQPTPSWRPDTAPVATQADDLLVSLEIDPNAPGTRFLVVHVADTRRPVPAPVSAVVATVGDLDATRMTRTSDSTWTVRVHVPSAGPLPVHLDVLRSGMPTATVTTTWTIAPTPGTQDGGPSLGPLVVAAIALFVVAVLLGLLLEYALAGVGGRSRDLDGDGYDLDGRGDATLEQVGATRRD